MLVFGSRATNIAKALAAFQRTLFSRNSPLDRYLAGEKKSLSAEAQHGWELFRGDAGCVTTLVPASVTARGAITEERRDN